MRGAPLTCDRDGVHRASRRQPQRSESCVIVAVERERESDRTQVQISVPEKR